MLGLRWLLAAVAATLASGAVRQLADGDFEGFAAEHATFLLLFYAPWCGHSRKLAPEYERVAADLAGTLAVARADGTEAEELATRLDVKGYPTVFFVRDGETDEYDGERTAGALGAWARAKLAPPLRRVESAAAARQWVGGRNAAVLLLPAGADEGGPLYRAMLGVAGSAKVPCAVGVGLPAPELAELGLAEVAAPALAVFASYDDEVRLLLDAPVPLDRRRMLAFIRRHSLPPVVAYSSAVEEAFFEAKAELHVLHFHVAPPELGPLDTAARTLDARFATVDVGSPASADIAEYFGIAPHGELTPPVTVAYNVASSAKYAHTGAHEAGAIQAFVADVEAGAAPRHVRSQPEPPPGSRGSAVEVVGSTWDRVVHDSAKDVLIMLYSPTCGHCRKLEPVWAELAELTADDAELVVAQMDATANDAGSLEPDAFPTIILYTKHDKRGVEYDGSRDVHDLVEFVKDVRAGRGQHGGLPDEEDDPDAKAEL